MEEMEEEEEGCVWKEEEVVVLEQQLSEEKRRKGEAGYPPWSTTWSTIPNLNLVSQPICLFFL